MILGIDTSNYTTSLAVVSDDNSLLYDERRLLSVKDGQLGLRQSEAFFQHIMVFPELYAALPFNKEDIKAVCVSERPRSVQGSYMPCFKAGVALAQTIASTLNVPLHATSHQQGHIMAAVSGNAEIRKDTFLAVHLSGGTTELLKCKETAEGFSAEIVGKTIDISAGQLIDRIGVMCGMHFPCGKQMDSVCTSEKKYDCSYKIKASVKDGEISFSGAEAKCKRDFDAINDKTTMMKAVFICVCESLNIAVKNVCIKEGIHNVLFMGGVSESVFLRGYFDNVKHCDISFKYAPEGLSSDNAVGIAMLGNKFYGMNV